MRTKDAPSQPASLRPRQLMTICSIICFSFWHWESGVNAAQIVNRIFVFICLLPPSHIYFLVGDLNILRSFLCSHTTFYIMVLLRTCTHQLYVFVWGKRKFVHHFGMTRNLLTFLNKLVYNWLKKKPITWWEEWEWSSYYKRSITRITSYS